jgi:hypothetical protein
MGGDLLMQRRRINCFQLEIRLTAPQKSDK